MAEATYKIESEQMEGALKQQERMAKDVNDIASFFRIARFILPLIIVPTLLTIAAALICPDQCKKLPKKANKAYDKGAKLAKELPEKVRGYAKRYSREAESEE